MSVSKSWFFVVGAQKAGTTTLHDWLSKSDEVALPWLKETHFFQMEELFSRGEKWYMRQFKTCKEAKIFGEIDPEYMYFSECSERIKSFAGSPKLIFLLRDPLARAYSNYQMSLRRGYEKLSFSDALRAEEGRINSGGLFSQTHHGYLARSLYGEQIERMLGVFPNSQVKVLLFEDLYSSQEMAEKSLREVCEFLGIEHKNLSVDVTVRKNQASIPRSGLIRDFICEDGIAKKCIGKLIPSRNMKMRIMSFLDQMNLKPATEGKAGKDRENDDIPGFVYEALIKDLHSLQRLMGLDLSHWILGYEKMLVA